MTLITKDGAIENRYARVETAEEALEAQGSIIVPLAVAKPVVAERTGGRLGLSVPNDAPISDIAPHLAKVDLIAVEFPAFSDGRGFSLARRLRRAGFGGTLRASGPLIADQFQDALACGFDEIEVPETMANRQPVQQWMAAKDIVTAHYQSGYAGERSILQQRLDARSRE